MEKAISEFLPRFECTLNTIPGVNDTTVAKLLSEIGDIRRFPNADKLANFAGVAPVKFSSSGKGDDKPSKQGNRRLQGTIYFLAIQMIQLSTKGLPRNPSFYAYTVIREHAKEVKKQVPNRKHFEYMCGHREELVEEYSKKLGIDGRQNIMETFDIILERVRERVGKPLEEVENDLVGYAVLLEAEILRLYGGVRKVNEEYGSVLITNVGKGVQNNCFINLVIIFWVWEQEEVMEARRKEIRKLYEDNLP